jgi:hypothetical protein
VQSFALQPEALDQGYVGRVVVLDQRVHLLRRIDIRQKRRLLQKPFVRAETPVPQSAAIPSRVAKALLADLQNLDSKGRDFRASVSLGSIRFYERRVVDFAGRPAQLIGLHHERPETVCGGHPVAVHGLCTGVPIAIVRPRPESHDRFNAISHQDDVGPYSRCSTVAIRERVDSDPFRMGPPRNINQRRAAPGDRARPLRQQPRALQSPRRQAQDEQLQASAIAANCCTSSINRHLCCVSEQ